MGCEDYDPMYCECRDCSECPYRIPEECTGCDYCDGDCQNCFIYKD